MHNEYYTTRTLAVELEISTRTVEKLLAERQIGHYRVGGKVRIGQDDLEQYLKSTRVEPVEKPGPRPKGRRRSKPITQPG